MTYMRLHDTCNISCGLVIKITHSLFYLCAPSRLLKKSVEFSDSPRVEGWGTLKSVGAHLRGRGLVP